VTVLLDKKLTARQQWVLTYLSGKGWVPVHESTDDGADFTIAYGNNFGLLGFDKAKKSLQSVIRSLEPLGLTECNITWQQGGIYRGVGVARMGEYRSTSRGERAAISHDTYN